MTTHEGPETMDFCEGRWGMTRDEVMANEMHEFDEINSRSPLELYYFRWLVGFPAHVKYEFSPSGRLWKGTYRVVAPHGTDCIRAFEVLRDNNCHAYGEPTAIESVGLERVTSADEAVAAVVSGSAWSNYYWHFTERVLLLQLFGTDGRVDVRLSYNSLEWLDAQRAIWKDQPPDSDSGSNLS